MEKPPCPYHTPFKWDFCVKFTHFSHLKGVRGMRKTLMMNRTAGIDNNPAITPPPPHLHDFGHPAKNCKRYT